MRQIRHETLAQELRAVFYNPSDVGHIFLEAKFTQGGIGSLHKALREYSDIKLSSLAVVPEPELGRCLRVPSSDTEQVFAPGQWVQIKRGLYQGDVGLVTEDFRDEASLRGVQVMVVPRLQFTDEDAPSTTSSSKRKLPSRPPPQLFTPTKCAQEQLIRHKRKHVYSYKSWRFEYGLQVKVYSHTSLCPSWRIHPSLCRLFMDAKSMAGTGHLIEMSSMPIPSFWKFEPGEQVLVHSDEGRRIGKVLTSVHNDSRSIPVCEVDVEGEICAVPVANLEKDIILGQYVEVLAGVHIGKKGFVVGKSDTLLGVCIGQESSGLDFRVHANSVKLALPDFSHSQIPWLNVEVTVGSGPNVGLTGFVKDVAVTPARSLSITVGLHDGRECVVGYQAVRERRTRKLLMDHQPLKHHQQQFNVEVPWKEIEVIIQSGRFNGCSGIVKNVRRDFRGVLFCERKTRAPLLTYRPLEGKQLGEFSISSSIETMRTGPVPWLNLPVEFVKGEYKGQRGFVKDVNRYQVKPSLRNKRSGLVLTVERDIFTVNPSSKLVKIDYDALRFHDSHGTKYRLCDVFMPTARQSYYIPNDQYQRDSHQPFTDVPDQEEEFADNDSVPSTPFANDLDQETIFCAAWNASSSTPGHTTSNFVSRSPVTWAPWTSPSPLPSPFRSPSPSRSASPKSSPTDHWILHPNLVEIPIKVDIRGGKLDTFSKKDGIFVESIADQGGINIVHRLTPTKTIRVAPDSIKTCRVRPKPATEKGLMVIARNHPAHIGKFVRRIHHFYDKEKTEDNHCLVLITVDRSGPKESKGREFLEVHPNDLEFVKESTAERKWSTELLHDIRADFTYSPVDVRPRRSL
ncbi:hypothetical protein FB446DRAFT_795698 [Lentinula raphanica]|nr:hypothetical protein FB446DRAFT_795698 [Lentinula raphanica]